MKPIYYFARNNGSEGWTLEPTDSLEKIKHKIKFETYGAEFKIFKELDFNIEDK